MGTAWPLSTFLHLALKPCALFIFISDFLANNSTPPGLLTLRNFCMAISSLWSWLPESSGKCSRVFTKYVHIFFLSNVRGAPAHVSSLACVLFFQVDVNPACDSAWVRVTRVTAFTSTVRASLCPTPVETSRNFRSSLNISIQNPVYALVTVTDPQRGTKTWSSVSKAGCRSACVLTALSTEMRKASIPFV